MTNHQNTFAGWLLEDQFARNVTASVMVSFPEETFFLRFKAAFPKRRGANPSTPARKAFTKALRKGVDAETLIGAALAYAEEQTALRHVGTEFVCQMATWLNQERWRDYPAARPAPSSTATIWILRDSPEWPRYAAAYEALRGKKPASVPGMGGLGWHFATSLMDTRVPKQEGPAG